MKFRTQLVLAFLVLAVLPLSGIVLYSYASSQDAVRKASEQQAAAVAEQMDERMSLLTESLRSGIERVGDLPVETFAELSADRSKGRSSEAAERIVHQVGNAAVLFDEFEFVPEPVEVAADVQPPAIAPAPAVAATNPTPATAAPMPGVIIDVPKLLEEIRASVPTEEELRRAREAAERGEHPAPPAAPQTAAIRPSDPTGGKPVAVGPTRAFDWNEYGKRMEERSRRREEAVERLRQRVKERENERPAHEKKVLAHETKVVEKAETTAKNEKTRAMKFVFGPGFEVPVIKGGERVGRVRATVRGEDLLGQVLSRADRKKGEVPFAVDKDGNLFTASPSDRNALAKLDLVSAPPRGLSNRFIGNWVVATSIDPDSGLTLGVARPLEDSLDAVRQAAGRNFLYGLGLIGFALLGIIPLANHVTRDVKLVTAGAERIAGGDLDTTLPVRSQNEFGQLAGTFNRMARDLKEQRAKLVEEERLGKERELEQRLLRSDYERKSEELEEARRFQLSLLPKSLPQHRQYQVAAMMRTATEVGGDYYDFSVDDEGHLIAAIGDATGHGASAGTMVTIVKSLFSAYAGKLPLPRLLSEATATIKRMDLGRMAMALTLARFERGRFTIAAAGMPPTLVHRVATGSVDEVSLSGTPLGTLAYDYEERTLELSSGDTVLMMSDGFPELLSVEGDPLGYPRVIEIFNAVAHNSPQAIIDALTREADSWSGAAALNDDITFVVVKTV